MSKQLHLIFNAVKPSLVLLEMLLTLQQAFLQVLLVRLYGGQFTLIFTGGLKKNKKNNNWVHTHTEKISTNFHDYWISVVTLSALLSGKKIRLCWCHNSLFLIVNLLSFSCFSMSRCSLRTCRRAANTLRRDSDILRKHRKHTDIRHSHLYWLYTFCVGKVAWWLMHMFRHIKVAFHHDFLPSVKYMYKFN